MPGVGEAMHVPSQHDVRIRTLHQHRRRFASNRIPVDSRVVAAPAYMMRDIEIHASDIEQQMIERMHAGRRIASRSELTSDRHIRCCPLPAVRLGAAKNVELMRQRCERLHDFERSRRLNFRRLAQQLRRLMVTTIDEFSQADDDDVIATLAKIADDGELFQPSRMQPALRIVRQIASSVLQLHTIDRAQSDGRSDVQVADGNDDDGSPRICAHVFRFPYRALE